LRETDSIGFPSLQVGIGIQDVSIASFVLDEASKLGLGTVIQGYD
jgi:ornithine cyclodeaminase/alanine dehydrogenase-like protein (mu-crystallin family)